MRRLTRVFVVVALAVAAGVVLIGSAEAGVVTFDSTWGSLGSGDGQFVSPSGVATDATGNVYVADTDNHRIQRFSNAGAFFAKWGGFGTGNGQFNSPRSLATDTAGNVYVTDTLNHRIQKFDSNGTFLTKWGRNGGDGTSGSLAGEFNEPIGIATDLSGNVYVADTLNHRVQKFTGTGGFITQWGTMGSGDGQFSLPRGVTTDSMGDVYVSDNNIRVQKFTNTGTFLTKWGSFGSGDGQFQQPRRLATDSADNVYVADQSNHRIQKFTSTGTFITKWGSMGSATSQFNEPRGVALDAAGNVFVADALNHRIQKFAQTGSITIVKDSVPDDAQDFAFTTTGTGLSNFSLDDDGNPTLSNTQTFSGLTAGDYSVTEAAVTGWPVTALVCDTGESVDLPNGHVDITLAPGEDVTCTFTNTRQPGSVTIIKDALPDDAQDFGFTTSGAGLGAFTLDDDADATLSNTMVFSGLAPGNRTVTEGSRAGWDLTGLSCDTGESPNLDARRVDISLSAGEDVTCTFTNTKRGSLTIVKDTQPDDPQDFSFTSTGTGPSTTHHSETDCAIPDVSTVQCPFEIGDAGTVTDVEVGLRINHTFAADLDISLISPEGTTVELTSDNGGGGDNFGTGPNPCDDTTAYTTFDDSAASSIVGAVAPFTGSFRPEGSLGAFAGEERAGTWTLRIVDDLGGDTGQLLCWRLTTATDSGEFSLDDDEDPSLPNTQMFPHLRPGDYSITEDAVADWALTGLTCDTGESPDLANRRVDISLGPGEDATCTFTNGERGSITIIKESLPDDAQDFSFTGIATSAPQTDHSETDCAIPDVNTVECPLEIADAGTLVDVDAGIRIDHTADADLDIALVAPDSTVVPLVFDRGGGGQNFGSGPNPCDGSTAYTTLDDAAGAAISAGSAPFAGSFRPESSLGALTGKERAGTWKLRVTDDAAADVGTVRCWRLRTTTSTGDLGAVTLDDDTDPVLSNTAVFSDLAPGGYSFTEAAVGGWDLTALTCDTGESAARGNGRVDITLGAGEHVTCTYTNTKRGSITIVKNSQPDDPQDFAFTTTGSGLSGFGLDDDAEPTLSNTRVFSNLVPGNYSVTEGQVHGWALTGMTCDTGESPNLNTRRVDISLAAGEDVTCTFTNTRRGSITVVKDTMPDDAHDFTFSAALPVTHHSENDCALPDEATVDCPLEIPDGGTLDDVNVGIRIDHTCVGDLDISLVAPDDTSVPLETNVLSCGPDYGTGPNPCDGSTVYTTFDDSAAEPITGSGSHAGMFQPESPLSDLTGKGRGGVWSLHIEDQAPADEGTVLCWRLTTTTDEGEFGLDDDADPTLSSSRAFLDLLPGDYSIVEDAAAGWDLTGLECDLTTATPDIPNRRVDIALGAGDNVTCTYTNTKDLQPDTTIAKPGDAALGDDVINDDGTDQTLLQKKKRRKTATFDIEVFNDGGHTESFVLDGDPAVAEFKVTYLLNAVDVTAAMVAGTQVIGPLAPGASETLQLEVRAKGSAARGDVQTALVTATSQALPGQLDAVKAKVKVK